MSDNKMRLKIDFDNIDKAEKPVQSLVNFFISNCSLRMINKKGTVDTEIESDPFEVITNENNWQWSNDTIALHLNDTEFNGKCKFTHLKAHIETNPEDESEEVSIEDIDIPLDDEPMFSNLTVENGVCKVLYEEFISFLSDYNVYNYTEVSTVQVQLTHKSEVKTISCAANIVYNQSIDDGFIASIKYENEQNELGPDEYAEFVAPDSYDISNLLKVRAAFPGPKGAKLYAEFKHTYKGTDLILYSESKLIGIASLATNAYASDVNSAEFYKDGVSVGNVSDYLEFTPKDQSKVLGIPTSTGVIGISLDPIKQDTAICPKGSPDNMVIDCNTKFVKAKTELKFGTGNYAPSNNDDAFDSIRIDYMYNMLKIPVTITPYCNGKENTDENIIPQFVDDAETEDVDESVIQNYKITSNRDLTIDWKLRTSTFTLLCDDGSAHYDVFYKLGICPFDGTEASEKVIIDYIKCHAFNVNNWQSSDQYRNMNFTYANWAEERIDYSPGIRNVAEQTFFPPRKYYGNSWSVTYGILYFMLCDSETGKKFDSSLLKDVPYHIVLSYDRQTTSFYIPIKDYNIDKGYIPSILWL